jgi:hypothetical protein
MNRARAASGLLQAATPMVLNAGFPVLVSSSPWFGFMPGEPILQHMRANVVVVA